MPECLPEKSPCTNVGYTLPDWAYSIFKRLCEMLAWLASIRNVLGVKPTGAFAIVPSLKEINAPGTDVIITIPAGALAITAAIDAEYAGDHRLRVFTSLDVSVRLPAGVDYVLPPITPVFSASESGTDAFRGHGAYPETRLKFPAGSNGTVIAIYPTTGKTITSEAA